ncbi:hypothetical protein ACFW9I_19480 [[Kitasatospora] papulosa]|uniref:hypothetical protein n=1 Tax=[Kitasatospora] papulosa TaxID=1464011 RepID=UPI0036B3FB51
MTDFSYHELGSQNALGAIISGRTFNDGWERLGDENRLLCEAYLRAKKHPSDVPDRQTIAVQVAEWQRGGQRKVDEILAEQDAARRERFQDVRRNGSGISKGEIAREIAESTSNSLISYAHASDGSFADVAAESPGAWQIWQEMEEYREAKEYEAHSSSHQQDNGQRVGRAR